MNLEERMNLEPAISESRDFFAPPW